MPTIIDILYNIKQEDVTDYISDETGFKYNRIDMGLKSFVKIISLTK